MSQWYGSPDLDPYQNVTDPDTEVYVSSNNQYVTCTIDTFLSKFFLTAHKSSCAVLLVWIFIIQLVPNKGIYRSREIFIQSAGSNYKSNVRFFLRNFCDFSIDFLKGPKHEIFESGFLTQIRGLWLGELGTGEKNWNFESWSHYSKVFAAKFLLSVPLACA